MGAVYRKTFTKPLPADATVRNDRATWRGPDGRKRTGKVTTGADGTPRVRIESGTYTAKYRNGSGRVVETATGCRDRDAARAVLHELEQRAERTRGGLVTGTEAAAMEWSATPLHEHRAAYIAHLEGRGTTPGHCRTRDHDIKQVCDGCGFTRLSGFDRAPFERWLAAQRADGMSARSLNARRTAMVAFANWLIQAGRLTTNPFEGILTANERADRRHERRAFTKDELAGLLDAARRRPLHDATHKNRGANTAALTAATIEKLERLGESRALAYRVLVMTGLRRGELAAITAADLYLETDMPYIDLPAKHEKARRGARIPLRRDLAADIGNHLTDRLKTAQRAAQEAGRPVPARLAPDTRLFESVPTVKVLNRDIAFAGIPKRDDRGKVLDIHSLRYTFCTNLQAAGVPMRTAQALMRHSDPKLTMNIYTDASLLDTRGAVDSLPDLPGPARDETGSALAPVLAPNVGNRCAFVATRDTTAVQKSGATERGTRRENRQC